VGAECTFGVPWVMNERSGMKGAEARARWLARRGTTTASAGSGCRGERCSADGHSATTLEAVRLTASGHEYFPRHGALLRHADEEKKSLLAFMNDKDADVLAQRCAGLR
jgi:hypothetical protein